MKKTILLTAGILVIFVTSCVHANWLEDIFKSSLRIEGLQGQLLNYEGQILGVQRDILSSQKDIDRLMQQVNDHLTGHAGWGSYQSHDYQSYGGNASDWSNVIQMADFGSGAGALGQTINLISKQFPIDKTNYNRGIMDERSQRYYALNSQTVLATRAASQLDYNKIQDQIAYQRMLQEQIEKTKDLKGAVDLSSRIQVEGNLIQLEILRQAALINQQQAITEQASVNAALANAKFLTK